MVGKLVISIVLATDNNNIPPRQSGEGGENGRGRGLIMLLIPSARTIIIIRN